MPCPGDAVPVTDTPGSLQAPAPHPGRTAAPVLSVSSRSEINTTVINMCLQCLALNPNQTTYDDHGVQSLDTGDGTGGSVSATLPTYTLDQIADYLTAGFWQQRGGTQRSFDVQTGDQITVNLNSLDATGRATAREALDSWTAVTGIEFVQSSSAQITFDDNQSGAYAYSMMSGSTITSSHVNVQTSWQGYGDYYLQTYIHEIGHALGLGHGGNYNGSADFNRDAHYANDSWQMTVMSYFSQTENPYVTAGYTFLGSAMMADIVAIQNLYGTPANAQSGDSTYGDNTNESFYGAALPTNRAVTIFDSAGNDTISLTSRGHNQRLDLRAEHFSDINGRTGNLAIARGTVIENAQTGGGNDHITGNDVGNDIYSGGGNDTILGLGGNDVLTGGAGADTLTGGAGADRFVYLDGGDGGDTITDFDLAAGDRIDIRPLLAAVGYTGSDPVADGLVWLANATGGSWLMFDPDGNGSVAETALVFLAGLASTTSVGAVIDATGDTPTTPDDGGDDTGDTGDTGGGGGTGSTDTIYIFTESFAATWSDFSSVLTDGDGGTDTMDLTAIDTASRVNLTSGARNKIAGKLQTIATGTDIENLLLGSGNDTGYGNALDNVLDGGVGNDRLFGALGNDTLSGGIGADRLYGGDGDDTMNGGEDNDRLYGDEGNDAMTGDLGNDYLKGQAGADSMDGDVGDDKLYGGAGADSMIGGEGDDYLKGDGGNDVMIGGNGLDKLYGGFGDDEMSGGDGKDYLRGDEGHDLLDGGNDADRLYAGDGDDIVYGGDGDDYLRGDAGSDLLDGGTGDDRIYGNNGDDTIAGGTGNDFIRGDFGADTIAGGDGADMLYGNGGDDVLAGGAGNDLIKGGVDNDILRGDDGDDFLYGEAGDDTVEGGAGDDYIDGSLGSDLLYGGGGADFIKGGSGADIFAFRSFDDAGDTIYDMKLEDGDQIELSQLFSDINTAISTSAISLMADGRSSWLMVDNNGDAVQLAYLRYISADTVPDDSWLI